MQCRNCQAQMSEGSLVCPSCQAPVQFPITPDEQFAEPAPFREYSDVTSPYIQQPIAAPTYSPVAMPEPNAIAGVLPLVAPMKPRVRARLG
ncbi:hypothetical protein [Ktedonospora formicarum]|uniref:Uncharacterized protein n=1 Tax=Ktedonospora formicarum TaxID=2778364 RepID=A0A8J3I345_9CHLR|nr:hypothetical protein [Ktedonospora formicarum]GHO45975.1 hypothetical protein KSX_41380 [Ktedonospora formicarum]